MSEAFPLPLLLEALGPESVRELGSGRGLFKLTDNFIYVSKKFGMVTVPAGLITDFASIPRPALWFIDDDDPGIEYPSVIHDYIYTNLGKLPGGVAFERQQADELLREAMLVCGASAVQARVVYLAVRAGGGSHWK